MEQMYPLFIGVFLPDAEIWFHVNFFHTIKRDDVKLTDAFDTMSEIIASVYDKMEETGLKEGILFIDEINCASETLAPAMLQFLVWGAGARRGYGMRRIYPLRGTKQPNG